MLAKENPRWGGPLDFMLRFTASKNNYTAKTACWHYGCFHGSKPWFRFTDIEIEFEAFAEGNSCSHTQGFIRQKKLLLLLVYFFFLRSPCRCTSLIFSLPPFHFPNRIFTARFFLLERKRWEIACFYWHLRQGGGRGAQPGFGASGVSHTTGRNRTPPLKGRKALKTLCHESELGERRMPVWIVQWKIIQEEGSFHKKSLCALPKLSLFPHF